MAETAPSQYHHTEEAFRLRGIKSEFIPCLLATCQQQPVYLGHPLPFPPVACYPVMTFPAKTARDRNFRIPAFFGSIKPHFLPVHLADDRNFLLDMTHLISFLDLSPSTPQQVAREQALPPLRALWSALLASEFRPANTEVLHEEYLISYFYRPLLGAGPPAKEAVARWKVERDMAPRQESARLWGEEVDSDEREDKLLTKLVAKRKLKRRSNVLRGASASGAAGAGGMDGGASVAGLGAAEGHSPVHSGSEEEEEEEAENYSTPSSPSAHPPHGSNYSEQRQFSLLHHPNRTLEPHRPPAPPLLSQQPPEPQWVTSAAELSEHRNAAVGAPETTPPTTADTTASTESVSLMKAPQ